MKTLKVKITFIEELLGSSAANPDIHAEYIASNAPDAPSREEEIAAVGVEKYIENAMTVFPRNADGQPIIWDYQIRGFFKAACGFLRKVSDSKSKNLKAFKKEIDGLVHVKPRMIPINFEGEISSCQRPLRAETAQGARVALANSESIPAGATAEFEVIMLNDDDEKFVREWLDFGQWNGLGQWRNSGKGSYLWEELNDKGEVIGGNLKAR